MSPVYQFPVELKDCHVAHDPAGDEVSIVSRQRGKLPDGQRRRYALHVSLTTAEMDAIALAWLRYRVGIVPGADDEGGA